MKKTILVFLIAIISVKANAQLNYNVWKGINESEIFVSGKREIVPEKYKTYRLDLTILKQTLSNAPNDKVILINNSSIIVTLPMPNGEIQKFKVVEAPIMDADLQMAYPTIKTYSIKGIDDVYANGKIDVTEFGFHGMIRSIKGDVFIDPYCRLNTIDYISYYTKDFIKPLNERNFCEGIIDEAGLNKRASAPSALICAGTNLRTYRLAVACTGEYAVAATGLAVPTVSATLAKVVISVNRVDGVYESEVAIRLVLVSTTTLVLFTASNSGFTAAENSNSGSLISKSQSIITASVGTSNFDIGHTFSTGGGGLANLGCVCSASSKASGITGNGNPVGDPYDIDYVAHEIGHQFSGNHTFNANTGSCSGGNRNNSTSVEPGSGVSIMAYAGICGSLNDVASNSIAYFHAISYDEIMNFTTNGGGSSCDVVTATSNNPPAVMAMANFVTSPNTPFVLTGSATDPDAGDILTFQWEEIDPGTGTGGNWNSGSKPFFRSYNPTAVPSRSCPTSAVVASGNLQGTIGEYVPLTAQILKFRLTARDNKMGGGGVCSATTQVTVLNFLVTSQNNAGIVYLIGTSQAVTWNVNNTDLAPINCANVNIYLSTNSGTTYSLMVGNTPNDGSENIILPSVISGTAITTCRIKVQSVGPNVFFDANNFNFTIATALGLNENSASNSLGIQLYPNPFSGFVKIDILNNATLDISNTVINVYDVLGKILRTESIKLSDNFSKTYDFSNLPNGAYLIEVTDGKQKGVSRLIKL